MVSFYFDGKVKEEDFPSELYDDLYISEDEWGKDNKTVMMWISTRRSKGIGRFSS